MIQLNKNSWHARFYRWSHGIDSLPQSLCTYFWNLVLTIVFAPLVMPLSLAGLLNMWVHKLLLQDDWEWSEYRRDGVYCLDLVATSTLYTMGLGLVGCALYAGVTAWGATHLNPLQIVGVTVWIVIILCTLVFCLVSLVNWLSSQNYNSEKKPSLLKEFIKAKVNKYCPKINWK